MTAVENKDSYADAIKSAKKVVDRLGLKKYLKFTEPKGKIKDALVAEETAGNKFKVLIKSDVTPDKGGKMTIDVIGKKTACEIATGIIKTAKEEALMESLKECGLV